MPCHLESFKQNTVKQETAIHTRTDMQQYNERVAHSGKLVVSWDYLIQIHVKRTCIEEVF